MALCNLAIANEFIMPNPAKTALLLWLLALAGCQKQEATNGPEPRPPEIVSRSGVEMILLPGGEFTMGSNEGNPDEAPAHKVSIGPFVMDKYPVTHEMFAQAQLPDPSHWQDNPKKPVERVRWRDAKRYCNERSLLEDLKPCYDEKLPDWPCDYSAGGYRLPTEAEWEYAARGGSEGPYEFGPAENLRQYAWYAENSDKKTHPVGQKKPNRWGLYDMYGNVSQWCEDVYSPTYYQSSPAADPKGPPSAGKGPIACSAAAIGSRAPRPAVRAIGRASAPATPTPALAPTTAGSAACDGPAPRN